MFWLYRDARPFPYLRLRGTERSMSASSDDTNPLDVVTLKALESMFDVVRNGQKCVSKKSIIDLFARFNMHLDQHDAAYIIARMNERGGVDDAVSDEITLSQFVSFSTRLVFPSTDEALSNAFRIFSTIEESTSAIVNESIDEETLMKEHFVRSMSILGETFTAKETEDAMKGMSKISGFLKRHKGLLDRQKKHLRRDEPPV